MLIVALTDEFLEELYRQTVGTSLIPALTVNANDDEILARYAYQLTTERYA